MMLSRDDNNNQDSGRKPTPSPDALEADLARLELGSEPYWMQDIRMAQRRIQALRQALHEGGPPTETGSGGLVE
jgi:hypothetical protein